MKIKRSQLVQMVKEEIARHTGDLLEASKGASVSDAEDDKRGREGKGRPGTSPQPDPDNSAGKPKGAPPKAKAPDDAPPEQAAADDPADPELDKDGEDPAAAAGEKRVSDQLVGKRIQSVTVEPKSKIMPGAQEIVLTFDDIPDAFRVLVTRSGRVAYYFKGLHNEL